MKEKIDLNLQVN